MKGINMAEYKIIYRDGNIYKIIGGINNEDSAYEFLAMVIKAGYNDSRIEMYESTDSEMNEVIESIIHHARTEWGIEIVSKDKIKMPEAKELWAGAYTDQWNLPLSKLNK